MLDVRDETPGSSFGRFDTVEQKAARAALYRTVDERLNALPGVRAASVSWLGLFSQNDLWLALIDADRPDSRPEGRVDYVSPRYFETMGMQILLRRRTREIGIRLAFGAERRAVLSMVLGDALKLVAAGIGLGVPIAIGGGYALRAFLFGVAPVDPAALAGACAVLALAALLSACIPARRAAAVDPLVALRWE
jgi:hypothetical protein